MAAFVRSDLSIPAGAAKFMSLYLLLAIGFKGGASLAAHGIHLQLFLTLLGGVALSFAIPFVAFGLLRVMTKLDALNAAAVAGHYGSISIVTFVTATSLLDLVGLSHDGFMVGRCGLRWRCLQSCRRFGWRTGPESNGVKDDKLWRDLLANGSIVLLTGAFLIGAITGGRRYADDRALHRYALSPVSCACFCWIWACRQGAA